MNIIKFAMDMELDGINYYEEMKSKYSNPSLNNIFDILIKNEQEHYEICKNMLGDKELTFTNSSILSECSNVFEELKNNADEINRNEISDLLNHAMDIEKQSVKLYSDLADNAKTENNRKIYEKIVGEEQKHYYILKSMASYFNGDLDSSITNSEFEGWNVDGMY